MLQRELGWYGVTRILLFRDGNVLGESTVLAILAAGDAEDRAAIAEVELSAAAVETIAARRRSRRTSRDRRVRTG